MNQHLTQVRHWMAENARAVRQVPPTGIPSVERFSQSERLIESLWAVIQHLGLNPGRAPVCITTGEGISPPPVLLAVLTQHIAEVHATFHMTGLGAAQNTALSDFTARSPNSPSPDWKVIVDETYAFDEPAALD